MKAKTLALTGLFSAMTIIGSYLFIPIGPVPITMQTLFALLAGYFLGPVYGAASQILYILLGLIGLPVFAGGFGGYQIVFKPSFGFLLGFILAAWLVGLFTRKLEKPSLGKLLATFLIGNLAIYLIGLPYMYFILTQTAKTNLPLKTIIYTGFLVFLPGDLLKTLMAAIIAKRASILKKSQ